MQSIWFKICLLITIIGGIILLWVDKVQPGIIAFELAKTIENANSMVVIWKNADVIPLKKFSLYFDYIFIIGYAGTLYILLEDLWQKTSLKWVRYLSFLPIVAGVLDGIENLGLLQIVYDQGTQFSASLAYYCASTKFALLVPSILGGIYRLSRSLRPGKS